ncbi:MAG: leucyl/phenylalanyl-tRNA--protein transferase [Termitinemataceae bacterium]|nr:MAG: leucyl/phenylalanyl-tRNA--protein transferase [Termitinemataceae bacterium]
MIAGPDPDFPYLSADKYFKFPNPAAVDDDIVCIGGNLSPGMLLSAYRQGIFPWYNEDDPVIWQSPDPRFVIYPQNLHISDSMKKLFKQKIYEIRFDTAFEAVILGCSAIKRHKQDGTWITNDIISAYSELHSLGWAHSAEAFLDGELAGGCYGILIDNVFFGESMFAKKPNASKAAFLTYAQKLFAEGIRFIDCQVPSDHLRSMGGTEISKKDFLNMLNYRLE